MHAVQNWLSAMQPRTFCRTVLHSRNFCFTSFTAMSEASGVAELRPWKEPAIRQVAWDRFQLIPRAVRKEWRQFVQLHPVSTDHQQTREEFIAFMDERHTRAQTLARSLASYSDLRSPHEWYPIARSLQRRVIFHAGPTNSGKTHQALEAVCSSSSSVYSAPLRLLAAEVFDILGNREDFDGTVGLLTGDDRRGDQDADHVSCTVEMAPLGRVRQVAVLDEVQLLAEPRRGWAWTRALLGLPAHELHICGSLNALPAIERLLAMTGETLEVNEYERKSPLVVSAQSLKGRLAATRPGDAVVAFSRKELYALRHQLETRHSKSVSMVYGALPPENRSEQVERFNSGEADVLVASDAIGMGLNLNIKRVIFSTMHKYDGESMGPIDPAAVLQIGGRAGRFNFAGGAVGETLTLHNRDMSALRSAFKRGPDPLVTCGLLPSWEQLELFGQDAEQLAKQELSLSELLLTFEKYATLDTAYFMCDTDEQREVAEVSCVLCAVCDGVVAANRTYSPREAGCIYLQHCAVQYEGPICSKAVSQVCVGAR